MDALEELMKSWNCEQVTPALKENGVTLERLQYLASEDIREIIKVVGLRAEFREKLAIWKKLNFNATSTLERIESGSNCSTPLGSSRSNCSTPIASFFIDVLQILEQSGKGRSILSFYKQNNFLLDGQRNDIINIVIEKTLENKIKLHSKEFLIITKQIASIFPTEKEDFYYTPRGVRKNPSGKLYDKFYNLSTKRRKLEDLFTKKHIEDDETNLDEEYDTHELEKLRNSMMNNISASFENNDVGDSWKKTFPLRREHIKEFENNFEFLLKWPSLKQAFGYKLIEYDFDVLYPKKKDRFLSCWENFKKSIHPYYQANIKDRKSREIFFACQQISNIESIDFIFAKLLNSIILPTTRFRNGIGKATRKYTILDADESFAVHLICINNYSLKLQQLKDKYFESSTTLQPVLIVVGADIYQLEQFFVYFDNILYKFSSFIESLTICFEIFHVLNLKYPKASQNLWLFIQKYFFDISTKFDTSQPSVMSLISFLDRNHK